MSPDVRSPSYHVAPAPTIVPAVEPALQFIPMNLTKEEIRAMVRDLLG